MNTSDPGTSKANSTTRAKFYCATCDVKRLNSQRYEEVNDLLGGTRYICPKADFWNPHVACVVIAGTEMKRWLKFQVYLQTCVGFPYKIPCPASLKPWRVGIVHLVSIGILVAILLFSDRIPSVLAYAAAGLLAIYTLATNTATVFVSRRPRDAFRAIVFALFSFGELVLAFSVIYLGLPCAEFVPPLESPGRAIYFSTVTFATVGFGDIRPAGTALLARSVVTGQIFIGLYFLAWISTERNSPKN